MNILLLSWRGPGHPNAGGAEISTHEHAKGWVRAGHSVTLFTSFYEGAKTEEILDGVKIIRKGNQILGVHLNTVFWYLFGDHPKYDIVVDQFHGIPFFIPFYVRAKKIAFIHEVAKEVWRTNFSLIPAIVGEMLEPLTFKLYKKTSFMTVSESTKKDLITWGIPDEKIKVIHNGVTIQPFNKLPSKEKIKTLIFLGAISKDKGIEDALKVLSILIKKDELFKLWVVGKSHPRYLQDLKKLSRKFNIEKYVKFWGYVSQKLKFELLSRAHVLVNPSIREGWGLTVIEAASQGTPTVAYNVPGLKDSIRSGKTGILCQDKTPSALAESILNLLSNEKIYIKISDNAKQWTKKFSWEKAGDISLKLLEKINEKKKL